MKRIFTLTALMIAVASCALAQTGSAQAPANTETAEQSLTRIEQEWAAALIHKDAGALDRIMAADYVSLTPDQADHTKAELLTSLNSGSMMFTSIANGKMRVRVFGTTAIVTGSEVEKSSLAGKDTSGHYEWTDVFANRQGAWQAVASESRFIHK
jgi:ketosteroid isomerase-like protein